MAPVYMRNYRELPTYNAPTYNSGEVTALTQKRAAPGLRALRQQINQISGQNFNNPNMKRMTLRDALAGYGMGVSNVMGQASSSAASEYGQKFNAISGNAEAEYGSRVSKANSYNEYAGDVAKSNYEGDLYSYRTSIASEEAEKAASENEKMTRLKRQWDIADRAEGRGDELDDRGYAEVSNIRRLNQSYEDWKRRQELTRSYAASDRTEAKREQPGRGGFTASK